MGMENGSSSSSGAEILKRLNKGEICEEELKKLIGIQWEKRLQWGYKSTHQEQLQFNLDFIKSLKEMEITEEIETALKEMEMTEEKETFNNETYELPTKAMESVYGNKLKQSAGYFVDKSMTLDEAEEAMYKLYCERAQIKDGQTVLDVGCGHGGLAFYIAQKYRKCHVTGITNSTTQVNYIKIQSKKLELSNVDVILADVTQYDNKMNTFDRIMAIGVIEHIKNIEQFMKKLSTWMKEDGLLFLDHLCHKSFSFPYEAVDEDDWYSGYIFPKGCLTILWSSCLLYFQDDVSVVDHWTLNGMHVARTGLEWLKKLEQNMETIREILLEQQKQQQPAATATDGMEGGNEVEVEVEAAAATATEAVNQLAIYLKTMCIGFYVTFSSNNGEELMNAQFLFKKK